MRRCESSNLKCVLTPLIPPPAAMWLSPRIPCLPLIGNATSLLVTFCQSVTDLVFNDLDVGTPPRLVFSSTMPTTLG